jgi:hypothetical protein
VRQPTCSNQDNPGIRQQENDRVVATSMVRVSHSSTSSHTLRPAMACHASGLRACIALHVHEQIYTGEWLEEGQSHVTWRGDEGVTRTRRDRGRPVAHAAGGAMDARGLDGLGQGHRRQDGGEPPGQHRRARPRRAEQEGVVVTTPTSSLTSRTPTGSRCPGPSTHGWGNRQGGGPGHESASSSILASCKSAVSKPSVNQP